MILLKPGSALGPCGWPNANAVGRGMTPQWPRLSNSHCWQDDWTSSSGRSVRSRPTKRWPCKSNPVRLGSYVSRALGASGDCGPSAGVLAAGPVETP